MSIYKMTSKAGNDCGPKILAALTDLPDAAIEKAMGISDIENFSDLRDSPWHHMAALEALKIPYKVITLTDVFVAPFNARIAILYHFDSTTAQHWIQFFNSEPGIKKIAFFDGNTFTKDGTDLPMTHQISFDDFTTGYAQGWPACSYIVGVDGGRKLPWYARAWVWLTNTFCGSASTWIFRKLSAPIFKMFGGFE